MKRVLLFTFLVVAAMVSCSKDEDYTAQRERTAATFTSSIDTRVSSDGTKWSAAENIGVTMFTLSGDVETLDSDNINYVSTNTEEAASVNFEAVTSDEEILYPDSGSVKFYAYYPYQADAADNNYLYAADVSDQTESIDFMVAAPVTTASTSSTIGLLFSHKLAKLTINIIGNDNVTDLTGVTASISGLSTTGSYDIYTGVQSGDLDGSDVSIAFNMSYGTAVNDVIISATATAIILPETLSSAATITFTLGTREFTISLAEYTAFAAGYNHSYTVALGNDYASFVGSTITGWGETTETELSLSVPDPDIVYDGDEDVYQIITPLGLETFAALVNGEAKPAGAVISGVGFASFGSYNTSINGVLTDNLDLEDICSEGLGKSWTPIGSYNNRYSGTFDGAEYEVSGLYIDTDIESYRHGLGLFGCISEATIKNLGVDGSVTYSYGYYSPYVGALVGAAYSSFITDCYNKCTVTATGEDAYVGGVVGFTSYANSSAIHGCTITGCYNEGAVTTKGDDTKIGGVMGYASAYSSNSSYSTSVTGCYNKGAVTAEGQESDVGGVVGNTASSSSLSSSYNLGTVTAAAAGSMVGGVVGSASSAVNYCYNEAVVTAEGSSSNIGGVVGDVYTAAGNSYTASVNGCYNSGVVTAEETDTSIGGIVGYAFAGNSSTTSVKGCYNSGAVTAKGASSFIGGVMGYAYSDFTTSSTVTLTSCYSYGSVSSASTDDLGGVLGKTRYTVTISYCYYDSVTVDDAGDNYPTSVVGTTNEKSSESNVGTISAIAEETSSLLAELKKGASSYWQADYDVNINNGYPILSWQIETND